MGVVLLLLALRRTVVLAPRRCCKRQDNHRNSNPGSVQCKLSLMNTTVQPPKRGDRNFVESDLRTRFDGGDSDVPWDTGGGYAREKLSALRGGAAEAYKGAGLGPERHKLLVSSHYSFEMLQSCAGEAAGCLAVPPPTPSRNSVRNVQLSSGRCQHTHLFRVESVPRCPPSTQATAVLWGRRCVGRECDTWAATGPLSALVGVFNVPVVHVAFAIVFEWCGSIKV